MKHFSPRIALAILLAGTFTLDSAGTAELFMQWEISMGGTNYDECDTLYPTADGGCVVAGGSYSGPSGNKSSINQGNADYWFVKLDGSGNKEWENVYGGGADEYANRVLPTPDGGYLLAGWSLSVPSGNKTNANAGARDYWLVKTDGSGNMLWEQVYGGTSRDWCWCMGVSSNNYLLGGYSRSAGGTGNKTAARIGNDDWWVICVDTNGNILWDAAYGGTAWQYLYDIQPTSDGGFLLTGESNSGISGNKTSANQGYYDGWVMKIDASGNKQWERSYGGTTNDWLLTGIEIDGGYIVGGSSTSGATGNKSSGNNGGADWWVIKLDTNGDKVWEKGYGGTDWERLKSIQPTDDGGYLLFGTTWSGVGGNKTTANFGSGTADYWLVKIDADGNILWQQEFGGDDDDYAINTLIRASDGGYIMGGTSYSGTTGNKTTAGFGQGDYWVVKIVRPGLSIDPVGSNQVDISWMPNTTGLVLQESSDLTNWVNSASGSSNPASVPTASPAMFYRLSPP